MNQKSYIEQDDVGRAIAAMLLWSNAYKKNRENPNLIEGVGTAATHYGK